MFRHLYEYYMFICVDLLCKSQHCHQSHQISQWPTLMILVFWHYEILMQFILIFLLAL